MINDKKNLIILLLILLLGIVLTVLLFEQDQNNAYKQEIINSKNQNDSILSDLLLKNEELIILSKQIQDGKNLGKGTQRIDGITVGDKPISLEELIDMTNQYQSKYLKLKNKSNNDSLKIERLNGIIRTLEKDKVLTTDKEGNIFYRRIESLDSLYKLQNIEVSELNSEINAKNTLLKLIKDAYGVDTEIEYGKEFNTVRLINTQKIDSALWIFPYYKHKIKTNKKGETFIRR